MSDTEGLQEIEITGVCVCEMFSRTQKDWIECDGFIRFEMCVSNMIQ